MIGGLPERLRSARISLGLTVEQAAALGGVTRKTWERYEKGGNDPKASSLTFLVERGVSPGWILTGQGEMRSNGGSQPGHTPSQDLIYRVIEGVTLAARETGVDLSSKELGAVAGRMLADLQASYESDADRLVALKVLLVRLREDLASDPAFRKRSA
jgi:transcriptional regulator with XRE-family HTH domain